MFTHVLIAVLMALNCVQIVCTILATGIVQLALTFTTVASVFTTAFILVNTADTPNGSVADDREQPIDHQGPPNEIHERCVEPPPLACTGCVVVVMPMQNDFRIGREDVVSKAERGCVAA
jgi:hypothetical protein